MDPQVTTPQAAPTLVEQITAAQALEPTSPANLASDSARTTAEAPAAPQASPVAPEAQPSQQAPQAITSPDSAEQAKLAEAEKRIRDAQAKMHEATTDAAKERTEATKLRNQLNALVNDPRFRQAPAATPPGTPAPVIPPAVVPDAELKRAFLEYQTASSDEAAFAKLVGLAEDRASRKTVGDVTELLQRREAEAAIRQRNMAAATTINTTVAESAPDVPLQLFWAMAGRAELETPTELEDYGQRIEWQVQRSIELSRAAMAPHFEQLQKIRQQQQQVNTQAAAIMPSGGVAPSAGTQAPMRFPTMVEAIRARQAANMPR